MRKRRFSNILSIVIVLVFAQTAWDGMQSDNYRIPTSVFSGGGAPAGSTNYQINSTLGQPSPLMQGDQNPYSDNYDNYPGFWYTMEVSDGSPAPDIKANGSDGPVELSSGDPLSVTISLDPGDYTGYPADWWCVTDAPFGWYYYDGNTGTWLPGFIVSYQGPLGEVSPPLEVLNISDLPQGGYTFYFGVDGWRNGRLDEPYLYYDSVGVTITP